MTVMERTIDRANPNAIITTAKLAGCLGEERQVAQAERLYEDVLGRKLGPVDRGFTLSEGNTKLRMRVGGTAGAPDGDEQISGSGSSQTFAPLSASGGSLGMPPGPLLVKVTLQNETPTATANVRAKSVTFSAGAGVPPG
jgi:hypothetical protein